LGLTAVKGKDFSWACRETKEGLKDRGERKEEEEEESHT
jgi:hypothetical protein